MTFDFNKYPQQPLILEDKRSEEEKIANAKLINEQRLWITIKRYSYGGFAGLIVGILGTVLIYEL